MFKSLTSLFLFVGVAALWSTIAAWHMGWALLALPVGLLVVLIYLMFNRRRFLSLKYCLAIVLCVTAIYPMSVIPASQVFRAVYGPRWYHHYRRYVAPIDYAKKRFESVDKIRIWYVR